MSKESLLAQIQQTPSNQIAELDFVKKRFVENYNLANKSNAGDLMYHRQLIHFNQAIAANDALAKADKFSLYACFVTAAANGYSFDPEDNEVYLIPRGGKAKLDRQAGAHVRRLKRTGQVKFVEQPKLVYSGDDFEVENGRVVRHVERFQSDTIVCGYVRIILDDTGADRFFIYRMSDFNAWKQRSQNQALYNDPGFLRTKIVKHACKEKCWASGNALPEVEVFSVEVDGDELEPELLNPPTQQNDKYADFEEVSNSAEAPTTAVKQEQPAEQPAGEEDLDKF